MPALTPIKTLAKPRKILSPQKQKALAIAQAKGIISRQAVAQVKRESEMQVIKGVKKIQLAQAKAVARAMAIPALGQTFVYKIVTHKDTNGRINKREHILIENPHEIAKALDAIANESGKNHDDENIYYYVSVKEPDYRAGEAILNRSIGKPAENTKIKVEHTFSLTSLARERRNLPKHVPVRVIEEKSKE